MFNKLLPAKLAIAAAFALPLAIANAPRALAGGPYYGAIAVSPQTGATGYSWDYSSKQAAVKAAIRSCEGYAGTGDCRGLVWFKNACGAIAGNGRGWGSGWGTNRNIASSYALQSCGKYGSGCKTIRTVCTSR